MKIKLHPLLKSILACFTLLLLAPAPAAWGAAISSAASGNWNTVSTWTGGVVPGLADDVTISSGHTVHISIDNQSAQTLTINGTLSSPTNATTRTLTLYGNLAANNGASSFVQPNSSPSLHITFAANASWTGTADISLFKSRVIVNADVTLDVSGASPSLKFKGAGATTSLLVFGNLITGTNVINGSAATSTFTLSSGANLISANPNGILNGTLGTIYNFTTVNLNVGANYTFNGTSPQLTLGLPSTVNNLTNNNPAGVALSAAITVSGDLQLNAQPLRLPVATGVTSLTVNSLNTGGPGNTLDIVSLPGGVAINDTFALITYTTINGSDTDFTLGTMPAGFTGHLNINGQTIELVIDTVAKSVIWDGGVNGTWNNSTLNWQGGLSYADGDSVTFDDTASGFTTINLTNSLIPGSLVVSNDSNSYTFTGVGSIGGSGGLIKEGVNSLTLANSGADTLSGGIALNAGSLIYDRSGNTTVGQVITGAGALGKNGSGTLTLGVANSYSGGSTVNAGSLRLLNATSAGSGAVVVNSGATFIAGAAHANSITLSNATLGGSTSPTMSGGLAIASDSTNTIYTDDPQNPGVLANLTFTGPLSGSGSITILPSAATTNSGTTTAACRFNGTTDGGYTGTITVGQRVKAEAQFTAASPFSSIGTGKFVLTCGTNEAGSLNGSFCNLLIRNNNGGDATFGNDLELSGTGLAAVNPLGTSIAGSLSTLGTLKIGNGQNLAVYRAGGNTMTLVFPNVTLTGGTATFSPHPPGFGPTPTGSDLSLGNLSQIGASSIVMDGLRHLSITGTANHTGTTTVSNGTLSVSGALAGNGAVTVAAGTLAGTGTIAGAVTVAGAGRLAAGTAGFSSATTPIFGVGTLTINNNLTLAGNVLIEVDNSLSPSNDVVNVTGTLAYGGTLTATNIGGGTLLAGDQFKIFPAGGSGNFASVLGSPGEGLAWSFSPATGTLSVVAGTPPTMGVAQSGNVLTFTWAEAGFKLQSQTNTIAVGLSNNWSDYPGGNTSGVTATIDPANPTVFFRLIAQ